MANTTEYNANRNHCEEIARNLERYADGDIYRCPECGEEFELYGGIDGYHAPDDDDPEEYAVCPHCGYRSDDCGEWEQLGLYDYFTDCYDIEYRIGGDRQFRSVRVMVACGGPNIYIDTASKQVELHWWTERASFPISYDTVDLVNDFFEELYECY